MIVTIEKDSGEKYEISVVGENPDVEQHLKNHGYNLDDIKYSTDTE